MRIVPSEGRLHAQEDIRGPLSELQQQVLPDIQDQIQDYRYIAQGVLLFATLVNINTGSYSVKIGLVFN